MMKLTLLTVFLTGLMFGVSPAVAEVVTGEAVVSGPGQITLDGQTIRLDDVRMPGPASKCAEWRGPKQVSFDCHEHAQAAMTSLVAGEEVSCVVHKGIGTCYSLGKDIAEQLVSLGWASTCGQTNRYVALEELARKARRGVWQGNFSLDTQCPAAE